MRVRRIIPWLLYAVCALVIAYFVFGKSQIPGWLRGLVIGGGIAAWVVVMALLLVFSGSI